MPDPGTDDRSAREPAGADGAPEDVHPPQPDESNPPSGAEPVEADAREKAPASESDGKPAPEADEALAAEAPADSEFVTLSPPPEGETPEALVWRSGEIVPVSAAAPAAEAEEPEEPRPPPAELLEPDFWPEPPLPEETEETATESAEADAVDAAPSPREEAGSAPSPEALGGAALAALPVAVAGARGGTATDEHPAGHHEEPPRHAGADAGDHAGEHHEDATKEAAAADDAAEDAGKEGEHDAAHAEGEEASEKASEESRRSRRPLVLLIGVVVVALLIAAGVYYWLLTRNIESTDDAFTDGRAVTIAPQVAGEVIALDVNDNQFVKEGQTLIQIDPRQYRNDRDQAEGALATAKGQYAAQKYAAQVARKNFPAQLEQSKAQLESAKASVDKTRADYERQMSLRRQATTGQDVDQALTALRQAEAQVKLFEAQVKQNSPVPQLIGQSEAQVDQLEGQVKQAQARLDQANLNLSWTTVKAPQDGWITRRNVEKGNYVVAGQQILSIVTPEVWVTANFKETQLTHMRPGQPVRIRIDAYPDLDVRGHVDSIQRGSGSKFTAFPPENATGNFVKIVQRVPVKIVIDSGLDPDIPMPLGISVVPTVTLR